MKTTESNVPQEKTHNMVLQDSSLSNLLTLTSDSLPDIFRKPIAQQQPDLSLQTHSTNEKVSKWGYGPSSSSFCSGQKIQTETAKLQTDLFKAAKEEIPNKLPIFKTQSLCEQVNPVGSRSENSTWYHQETSLKLREQSSYIFGNSFDKSTNNTSTSATATTLNLLSQPTVKVHPVVDQLPPSAQKPPTISLTGQSISSLRTVANSVAELSSTPSLPQKPIFQMDIPMTSAKVPLIKPQADSSNLCNLLVSKQAQPQEPMKPTIPFGEIQQPEMPSKLLDHPVKPVISHSSLLPPPNSRPPAKMKQITVNGKTFTVMKPLGRGGSSVVYQVISF